MPLSALRLQLMDPSIIGVEEIVPVRKHPRVKRMYRASCPSRWFQTSTVLQGLWDCVDSELDLVLDTGRLCRNQSPPPFYQLFLAHKLFDA
jgi:hypothetical protein